MLVFNLSLISLLFCFGSAAFTSRRRPQNEVNFEQVCTNKGPNEFFRINAESDCREVYQCSEFGLLPLKCPSGLVFDIERQTCDWKHKVKNCKQIEKTKNVLSANSTNSMKSVPSCNKTECKLPNCYCSQNGTTIPLDLPSNTVPQMIMITFDDAVNNNNIDIYDEIFDGERLNPNNCTIKATFFLSHKYSNYSAVQDLHRKGHEIAVHSITHNSKETYWTNSSVEQWKKEMDGSRTIFKRFANITDDSIVGMRVPLLKIGGDNQFEMMANNSFLYDSSIGVPFGKPIYPYTLHYRMPHKCHGNNQKCPTKSHAVWEIPMNEYDRRTDDDDPILSGCVMVDQCANLNTGELLYDFLNRNFDRHYNSNRAPLGLYFHASWLLNRDFLDSLITFIDEKLTLNDVYFTTMTQVIRWMQKPTQLANINAFEPWKIKCNVEEKEPACYYPNQCPLVTKELPGETNRLHTCVECPKSFPWLESPSGDDDS